MIVGIVGAEQAKFTPETEARARALLAEGLDQLCPTEIVSGACHLGGVDLWAEEIAHARSVPFRAYPAHEHTWNGALGYKARNAAIARRADLVLCIVVRTLPATYTIRGSWDEGPCYHCHGRNPPHVKSGGCWAAWRCTGGGIWLIV